MKLNRNLIRGSSIRLKTAISIGGRIFEITLRVETKEAHVTVAESQGIVKVRFEKNEKTRFPF